MRAWNFSWGASREIRVVRRVKSATTPADDPREKPHYTDSDALGNRSDSWSGELTAASHEFAAGW
jgi:hypothetical protein